MLPASTELAEELRAAFGRRQQTGQHLHGRGLAAAVGAEEAEDLAALDRERDLVDRREVAEAAREPFASMAISDFSVVRGGIDQLLCGPARFSSGKSAMKHCSRSAGAGPLHQLGRRARREHAARVHRHDPVPLLGLVHVRGRDHDAHARAARRGCRR